MLQFVDEGNIFKDIDKIEAGKVWREVIEAAVNACDIFITLIDKHWLDGDRLSDPNDLVRQEISFALKRGVRVIPVLVGGAEMPHANALPDQLRALCDRQSFEISDLRWRHDVERLVRQIDVDFTAPKPGPPKTSKRPGPRPARRPLHFIWILDTSGSMAADGKIQALNHAVREAIPQLRSVITEHPNAEMLVRALTFSEGAHWHIETPTPVESLVWEDLVPGGFTDMGQAMRALAAVLRSPPMEPRSLPPALVLVSDGQPTDDFAGGLAELLAEPWAKHAMRLAVAIGKDADREVLRRFIARPDIEPFAAHSPEQLAYMIRFASNVASRQAWEPETADTMSGAEALVPGEDGTTW